MWFLDRTHTLYEENPMNPDGPYVLNKGMIEMLKLLKERGIKCFILSAGCGTGDWRKNLIACQNELTRVLSLQIISFSIKNIMAMNKVVSKMSLEIYSAMVRWINLIHFGCEFG